MSFGLASEAGVEVALDALADHLEADVVVPALLALATGRMAAASL